jgi:Trypsin
LRLNKGDSGGPVFVSTVAAGVQSSGSFNSTTSVAYYLTYMTTDTLPSGVSLLYGP